MKYLFCLILSVTVTGIFSQTTYFIDNISGSDLNKGTSAAYPWKSLININNRDFQPGDSILFRRGGVWKVNIIPGGSGIAGKPIVMASYGKGPLPVLDAEGRISSGEKASYTIKLFNQQFWEFKNLEIRNYKPFEVPVKSKEGFSNSVKTGIYIGAKDAGVLHHFFFSGLEICKINGSMETKDNGGIFMEVTWDEDSLNRKPTCFVDVMLSDCFIHDVDRTGFSNLSVWKDRNRISKWGEPIANGKTDNWFPWKNVEIRNNRFERTGANALIVRNTVAPIIEYNLFSHCAVKGSGNATFAFNCDNAVFQHNESCYTVFNTEADSWDGKRDADAGGFDSDWNCKNTVIQYNYSHHNGFGGILVCCDGAARNGFNDGTIVRFNIFDENQHHGIRISGKATNTHIYNNLFFTGDDQDPVMIVYHKSWGGFSNSAVYTNNMFVAKGIGNSFNLGKSTGNIFQSNLFYGKIMYLPPDPKGVFASPGFICDDCTQSPNPWLRFMLRNDSPAIGSGTGIENNGGHDFARKPLKKQISIGPLEY
jgi:hypothetical protein